MARQVLGALTTLNLATNLDPMFLELYALRDLFTISGTGPYLVSGQNFGLGAAPSSYGATATNFSISATAIPNIDFKIGATREAFINIESGMFQLGTLTAKPTSILSNGSIRVNVGTSGNFTPAADNAQTLGASSFRWSVVYAGTGTINTSDAREKTKVAALDAAELAAATDLAREIGAFKYLESVQAKGNDARIHCGMTVQRAMEIMQSHGLTPTEYAFICHDSWPAEQVPARTERRDTGLKNSANEPIFEAVELEPAYTRPAGDRYGFRTDQLALFIARGQAQRQDELEARIQALEK